MRPKRTHQGSLLSVRASPLCPPPPAATSPVTGHTPATAVRIRGVGADSALPSLGRGQDVADQP